MRASSQHPSRPARSVPTCSATPPRPSGLPAGAGSVLSRIAQLDQRTALPDQCLHSAEAVVRPPRKKSGLDPNRSSGPICRSCIARQLIVMQTCVDRGTPSRSAPGGHYPVIGLRRDKRTVICSEGETQSLAIWTLKYSRKQGDGHESQTRTRYLQLSYRAARCHVP